MSHLVSSFVLARDCSVCETAGGDTTREDDEKRVKERSGDIFQFDLLYFSNVKYNEQF